MVNPVVDVIIIQFMCIGGFSDDDFSMDEWDETCDDAQLPCSSSSLSSVPPPIVDFCTMEPNFEEVESGRHKCIEKMCVLVHVYACMCHAYWLCSGRLYFRVIAHCVVIFTKLLCVQV